MKRIMSAAAAAVTVLVCGCRSAAECGTVPDKKSAVHEQGRKIIQAVSAQDFADYLHHAGEDGAAADEAGFKKSCQEMTARLGKMKKFTFLTELVTPEFTNLVYIADFVKSSGNGRELRHQQLIQLVFGEVDGRSKLMGIRVM
ncbi:MAG: hypothetical protein IKC89_07015 [Lentisphaeria bacterium]|nr:hypothetical protein [Lentisphaeria bacterium]